MKWTYFMAAVLLALVSCTQNNNSNTLSMNTKEKIEDVEGRKNFGAQHSVITPLPCIMIATYDQNQTPDVMMAAWGGQCGSNHICFNLSPHKTTDNLRLKKAFTVSFATVNDVAQSDYFGIVSGNKVPDKVARAGFTATPSPNVDAPIINEYPLTLECKVIEMTETLVGETRVVGEVVNMSAADSILTDGKVDLLKLRPIIFDSSNLNYFSLGDSVGKAWQTGKKYQ